MKRFRSVRRLPVARLACVLWCLMMLGVPAGSQADPMVTRWAHDLSPDRVWSEYPRPQLVREPWLNLNGLWDYAVSASDASAPTNFAGRILVPFPIESHLSGVRRPLEKSEVLWYRRAIVVPDGWRGQRIKLHFGAVDWETRVWVNGDEIGTHRGGYDEFTFDVTRAVQWGGSNEVLIAVKDPTEGDQPRGKQARRPEGIFYLPSSGIWQTVWMEPVPAGGIQALHLNPDLNSQALRVRVITDTQLEGDVVNVVARFDGEEAGSGSGRSGAELTIPLSTVRPWSPDKPDLYDLEVTLRRGTNELDRVGSYFGLREIRVAKDSEGWSRLFLNGEPLFQMGVLDQGFWPDGLYTAPSPEALRYDLEVAKRLGFNLVRKHVKVEPALWYYWADRLGLLVWQDMPSGNNASTEGRRQFELELQRMLQQLSNHPSIIMWVLFNEGWGQFGTERLVRRLKAADPTRLVNNASGWTDARTGDVLDLHSYPDPIAPASENARVAVLGEFGGLALPVEGHKWSDQTWGYQQVEDADALTEQYFSMIEQVWILREHQGLAAAVYTQLTDVETEVNGFLTYDRAVLKVDVARVQQVNRSRPSTLLRSMLLPDAQQGMFVWRFTTSAPGEDWVQPEFNDSGWRTGPGGFGTHETPGTLVNTEWNTPDIWLRREFRLPSRLPQKVSLIIHHDDDAKVWLNGVMVADLPGYTAGYSVVQVSEALQSSLTPGLNVMAIQCHQFQGGQYIDAGLRVDNGNP